MPLVRLDAPTGHRLSQDFLIAVGLDLFRLKLEPGRHSCIEATKSQLFAEGSLQRRFALSSESLWRNGTSKSQHGTLWLAFGVGAAGLDWWFGALTPRGASQATPRSKEGCSFCLQTRPRLLRGAGNAAVCEHPAQRRASWTGHVVVQTAVASEATLLLVSPGT